MQKITQPVPFGLLGIFPVIIDFHAAVASEIADAISDNDNFLDVGWIGHVKFSTKVENYLVSVMEETVKIKWKKIPVNEELTCQSCNCLWIMKREYDQFISINIICHG